MIRFFLNLILGVCLSTFICARTLENRIIGLDAMAQLYALSYVRDNVYPFSLFDTLSSYFERSESTWFSRFYSDFTTQGEIEHFWLQERRGQDLVDPLDHYYVFLCRKLGVFAGCTDPDEELFNIDSEQLNYRVFWLHLEFVGMEAVNDYVNFRLGFINRFDLNFTKISFGSSEKVLLPSDSVSVKESEAQGDYLPVVSAECFQKCLEDASRKEVLECVCSLANQNYPQEITCFPVLSKMLSQEAREKEEKERKDREKERKDREKAGGCSVAGCEEVNCAEEKKKLIDSGCYVTREKITEMPFCAQGVIVHRFAHGTAQFVGSPYVLVTARHCVVNPENFELLKADQLRFYQQVAEGYCFLECIEISEVIAPEDNIPDYAILITKSPSLNNAFIAFNENIADNIFHLVGTVFDADGAFRILKENGVGVFCTGYSGIFKKCLISNCMVPVGIMVSHFNPDFKLNSEYYKSSKFKGLMKAINIFISEKEMDICLLGGGSSGGAVLLKKENEFYFLGIMSKVGVSVNIREAVILEGELLDKLQEALRKCLEDN